MFHVCIGFYTFTLCDGGLRAKDGEGSEQGETRVRGQRGRRGQSLTSVAQIRQKSGRRGPGSPRTLLLPAESAANKERRKCLNTARSLAPSPALEWGGGIHGLPADSD